MKIHLLGDIGEYSNTLKNIVKNININKTDDVILFLGDNFYPSGVNSIYDSNWNNLKKLENEVPIWSVLGNHDYLGDISSQIKFNLYNWNLPNHYYKKTFDNIDFFFIDTSILLPDYSNIDYNIVKCSIKQEPILKSKEMIDWLEIELDKSNNPKILVGHYPIMSYGVYGVNKKLFLQLYPILTKYNVKYYISGHDHNLQIIDIFSKQHSMKQVISGATSSVYPILKNVSKKVFSKLGYIMINTSIKNISIIDSNSNILYEEDLEF